MATTARLERAIAALARSEPTHAEVGARCHELLEQVLDYQAAVWFSMDPATLLPTGFEPRFRSEGMRTLQQGLSHVLGRGARAFELKMAERMMRFELDQEDGLSPTALARTTGHVATLHDISEGHPDRNPRFGTFPLPGAIVDELRLLLMDAGECWGMVWLVREDTHFTKSEQRLLASVGSRLGPIVRGSLLRAALEARSPMVEAPGLILMKDDVHVQSVTAEAEALLGTAQEDWDWLAVLRALRLKHGRASMLVEGPAGAVMVHATRVGEQDGVIVERVRPYRLADRLVRTYGLTPRERDVAGGVSRGWSTRKIAFELDLADYTVQDHLRAIFDKVGVRSRKEVIAKLFFDRYMPEHRAQSVPSPYGGFLES